MLPRLAPARCDGAPLFVARAKLVWRTSHAPAAAVGGAQAELGLLPAVAKGRLIIQQKASCFSALALAPPKGAHVIDACAAPGSKTSHLAALLQNSGAVYAFDRDSVRLEILRKCARPPPSCASVRPGALHCMVNAKESRATCTPFESEVA